MKKGSELENRFEKWIVKFNDLTSNLAIRLEVKFNIAGRFYQSKQPCDYVIILKDAIWLIDSKECSNDKFYPKRQPYHQIESFRKAKNMGYRAGFVVWFRKSDIFGNDLRFIEELEKPSSNKDGSSFDFFIDELIKSYNRKAK